MENKYFTELAHRLQAAGITTGHPERNQLTVLLNDQPVLFVSSESDVFLLPAGSNPPEASELYHKVAQTAEEVYAYPRLVTDEEFLAVRLRRREQNTYAPCPSEIIPIRNKAVCALCGEKMTRDTKSHGRPRWRCKNPECGGSVYLDDSIILERVMQKLKVLAHSPEHIQLPKAAPVSTDALRIENELALCFNRADINPEYMKTLIMAAAAERYAGLNDPTPTHKLELLRQKLELEPESEETLWEVFESAVAQVRIGKGGEISLHQKDQKECAL